MNMIMLRYFPRMDSVLLGKKREKSMIELVDTSVNI